MPKQPLKTKGTKKQKPATKRRDTEERDMGPQEGVEKNKSNKAENGKGVEGTLGPTGLRGRVFVAAHGGRAEVGATLGRLVAPPPGWEAESNDAGGLAAWGTRIVEAR